MMHEAFELSRNDLQGEALIQSIRNNPSFIEEAIQGFAQIEAGENTVITYEELQDSIANDQGNRVLTKEHLEEVVLDPTGFKPFTLDTPFESGFLLQHIEGNLA